MDIRYRVENGDYVNKLQSPKKIYFRDQGVLELETCYKLGFVDDEAYQKALDIISAGREHRKRVEAEYSAESNRLLNLFKSDLVGGDEARQTALDTACVLIPQGKNRLLKLIDKVEDLINTPEPEMTPKQFESWLRDSDAVLFDGMAATKISYAHAVSLESELQYLVKSKSINRRIAIHDAEYYNPDTCIVWLKGPSKYHEVFIDVASILKGTMQNGSFKIPLNNGNDSVVITKMKAMHGATK
jgi:hypothetical protein